MQKRSKNLLKYFFFGVFFMAFVFCFTIWLVDPFEIWHKRYICKNEFYDNMRYNARRIINNGDFDSIIIGTSMLASTKASEASSLLGGKFANLSLLGSSLGERAVVLNYALPKKDIKKVIISLDLNYMMPFNQEQEKRTLNESIDFAYLYDDNYLDDYKIYDNIKYVIKIFKFKCDVEFNKDTPSPLVKEDALGGLENWTHKRINEIIYDSLSTPIKIKKEQKVVEQSEPDIAVLEYYKGYIDKNILSFATKFPNTQFIIIIPPYSIVHNAIDAQTSSTTMSLHKALINHILSSKNKNVKIYGFDNLGISLDMSNYVDLSHYVTKINSLMLLQISKGKNELSKENFEAYWQEFTKKAMAFDLLSFYEEFLSISGLKDKANNEKKN